MEKYDGFKFDSALITMWMELSNWANSIVNTYVNGIEQLSDLNSQYLYTHLMCMLTLKSKETFMHYGIYLMRYFTFWYSFYEIQFAYTVCNICLSPPNVLLEIRVIMKIESNPCYPRSYETFEQEWGKKNSSFLILNIGILLFLKKSVFEIC